MQGRTRGAFFIWTGMLSVRIRMCAEHWRRTAKRGIAVALLLSASAAASICLATASIGGNAWSPIGPAPIGNLFGGVTGRSSALAVNPYNGDQVWMGTASGGVWYSDDAGVNWTPVSDGTAALAVGAIAVSNCTVSGCTRVYVGSGENAIRRDTLFGRGVLIGDQLLGPPQPTYAWTHVDGSADGLDFNLGSIFNIVLVPGASVDTDRLYITLSSGTSASASESTVTAPEPASGYGIYRSLNGGANWSKITVPDSNGARPTDLEIDPLNSATMWAAFLGVGIFKSTNGGASWCSVSVGIPNPITCPANSGLPDDPTEEFDFIELTVHHASAAAEPIVYASLGHCNLSEGIYNGELLLGCTPSVYRSTDGGENWELRRPGTNSGGAYADCVSGYSYYTHLLEVDPVNPDSLFMGGVRLCRSLNGGQNFFPADYNVNPGIIPYSSFNPDPVIHADHHALAFHPQDANTLYSTSDGGIAVTHSYNVAAFLAWEHGEGTLQLTGFQSIDVTPHNTSIIGAAQDNGGMLWSGNDTWTYNRCCGDGGFARFDRTNPDIMYFGTNAILGSSNLIRTLDGGSTLCNVDTGIDYNAPAAFYFPVEVSVATDVTGESVVFRATNQIYRSRVVGPSNQPCKDLQWDEVSQIFSQDDYPEIVFGKNVITAIGLGGADNPERVYAGHYGGEIWTTGVITTDPFQWFIEWTDVTSVDFPDAPVTRIAVDPADEQIAYAAFSGFGSEPKVWKTTDAGLSWGAAATNLPIGVPVNTIHVEPGSPQILWAGLDGHPGATTIWRSFDSGATWQPASAGLPNVPVYEIALDVPRNYAVAATHGRGAWMFGWSLPRLDVDYRATVPWEFPIICDILPPLEDCLIDLTLADGTTCAGGETDALGAGLHTDAEGRLVTTLPGVYTDKPVAWGCSGGQCIGGVAAADCSPTGEPITGARVTCGAVSVAEDLSGVISREHLSSTDFGFQVPVDAGAGIGGMIDGVPDTRLLGTTTGEVTATSAGRFDLTASLLTGDGTTRSLCSVGASFDIGETDLDTLQRISDAINGSPTCLDAGVTAVLDNNPGGQGMTEEDDFGRAPTLKLAELPLTGTQLITAVGVAPGDATGACFAVDAIGVPVRGLGASLQMEFREGPAGLQGGEITLMQDTLLGICSVALQTFPGQTADEVAFLLQELADSSPGPPSDCPEARNLRNLRVNGATLDIIMPRGVKVCIGDAGLGVTLRPIELTNLHPAAAINGPATVECSGPAGATVMLDGSGSTDPDSTPGSNDDIVLFEWFEDFGMASQTMLGSGPTLPVMLPLGTHDVSLRVTDSHGLMSRSTMQVSIVDTTPPSLTVGSAPVLLYPPNHRLENVAALVSASDLCGPTTVTLLSVDSSEVDDAPGDDDGDTTGDVQDASPGTPDYDVTLRAERDRSGPGRTYSVRYSASDDSTNVTIRTGLVTVPIDMGGVVEPLLLTVSLSPGGAGAPGALLQWSAVAGAINYNAIAADLDGVSEPNGHIDLGVVSCLEADSIDTDTAGHEDAVDPPLGAARIYFVDYDDGRRVSYGTETARKPRIPAGGDCP